MYILQEWDFGNWSDLYSHSDYNYLLDVKRIMIIKHPDKKYRVIEVIEDV